MPVRIRASWRAAALAVAAAACVPAPPPAHRTSPDTAALDRAVRAALDPAADPCSDFYQYACGGWLAAVPPPSDRPQIMRSFSSIDARNRMLLVRVLERETDEPGHRTASAFFDSCMDVAGVEATGLHPLAPWLAEIDAADGLPALFAAAARLRRAGASPLVQLAVERDPLDPGRHVLVLAPGGLGLPDARLYLDDPEGIVSAYRNHVAQMLELDGARGPRARSQARAIVALETALARGALAAGEGEPAEGPAGSDVVRGRAALAALDPALPWDAYFAALGAPDLDALEVASPAFVRALGAALRAARSEDRRAYLRWQLLHALAKRLPRAFDEADFAFEAKLTGATSMPPRPDRCAEATLAALPDETSRAFVAAAFAGESRAVAAAMLDGIADAFVASLPGVEWMDEPTRAAAAAKAAKVVRKVGYPDPWPPGAGFPVGASFLENSLAAADARVTRELAAAGRPVDPSAWPVAPIALRGFYDPRANQMVVPAGLLQPPLFDVALPAAMRWGAAGAMMGHEWIHGFDAQGQLFDAAGRLAPWWSEASVTRFTDASQCLVERYGRFEVEPGLPVDGKRTFAENAADVGGLALAHRAWRAEAGGDATAPSPIAGLSAEQLFFVAYAQTWCASAQPGYDAAMARSDPRSRPRFRVDGPVSQLPAFRDAFSCSAPSLCPLW